MDKDAMITYLIGELKKENLELHDLIIPEELEEKQNFSEHSLIHVNQWQHQHNS